MCSDSNVWNLVIVREFFVGIFCVIDCIVVVLWWYVDEVVIDICCIWFEKNVGVGVVMWEVVCECWVCVKNSSECWNKVKFEIVNDYEIFLFMRGEYCVCRGL